MITTGLMSFLASTVIGAVFKLISMKMDGSRALREAELLAMNSRAKVIESARQHTNKSIEFTRRFMVIAATLTIIVLPMVVPVFYTYLYPIDVLTSGAQPSVWFGYDVVTQGFWPFTDSITETKWMEMKGVVITPFHTELISAMMGFYFGGRLGNSKY